MAAIEYLLPDWKLDNQFALKDLIVRGLKRWLQSTFRLTLRYPFCTNVSAECISSWLRVGASLVFSSLSKSQSWFKAVVHYAGDLRWENSGSRLQGEGFATPPRTLCWKQQLSTGDAVILTVYDTGQPFMRVIIMANHCAIWFLSTK